MSPSSIPFVVAAVALLALGFWLVSVAPRKLRRRLAGLERQLAHKDRFIETLRAKAERRARHIRTFEGRGRHRPVQVFNVPVSVDGDTINSYMRRSKTKQDRDHSDPREPSQPVAAGGVG